MRFPAPLRRARARSVATLCAAALAAACVPAAPRPAAPVPVPTPAAPVAPPAPVADWRDVPLTPGEWRYRTDAAGRSSAGFGTGPAAERLRLICDRAARQLRFQVAGATPGGTLTLRTTSATRTLSLAADTVPGAAFAVVSASDRLLDAIAFSRGRFAAGAPGVGTLALPAYAEVARVIEDCRG